MKQPKMDTKGVVTLLLAAQARLEHAFSRDGITPLLIAAMNGHDTVVDLLLKAGASCELAHVEYTPLSAASSSGHTTVVKRLLQSGADPEAKGRNGQTPLSIAVSKGYTEIIKQLLESGADPMSRTTMAVRR